MEIDRLLLLRKLANLQEYKKQLEEFQTITVEQYCSDWKIQRIVERTLQMMIELAADIASHLISGYGWRVPQTYAETFQVLGEQGMLPAEQTDVMVKMARFRNIVVHQYEAVDAEIVVMILKKHLADFEDFSGIIQRKIG